MPVLTVKGKREQPHSTLHTKNLVDNCVLWRNPADPSEIAKSRKDQVGKPIPNKPSSKRPEKEFVTRRPPRMGVTRRHGLSAGDFLVFTCVTLADLPRNVLFAIPSMKGGVESSIA